MIENSGIDPRFKVQLSRDALKRGIDEQLNTALEVAKSL